MVRIQLYEGTIERLAKKHARLLPKEAQKEGMIVLRSLLETTRETALIDSYYNRSKNQITTRDVLDYMSYRLDITEYKTLFDDYLTQVAKFTVIASKSDNPLETLRLLQQRAEIIGTSKFRTAITFNRLSGNASELEAMLDNIKEQSMPERDCRAIVSKALHDYLDGRMRGHVVPNRYSGRPSPPSDDSPMDSIINDQNI